MTLLLIIIDFNQFIVKITKNQINLYIKILYYIYFIHHSI